jgi:hypothetical protein
MAKRLPLNMLQLASGTGGGAVEKSIEDLLKRPEVARLQQLDQELKQVANDKSLPIEVKVKRFEQKLAEFRRIKNYLLMEGTQLHPEEEDGHTLEQKVKEILSDLLKHQRSTKTIDDTSSTEALDATSTALPDASVHEEFETPKAELSDVLLSSSTPLSRARIKPQKTHVQAWRDKLHKNGLFSVKKDRIFFHQSDKKEGYTMKTLNDAIDYMFSPVESSSDPPKQLTNVLKYIYEYVTEDADFQELLEKYPNLKAYHKIKTFPIPSWE